ncbi:uncharacterized protein PAC_20166 [Phialocephala subalpina]|uniref:IBR domain-containing protein n=1 Tax=Phialocephala subalpina TaxID=576137 RepID=A0A1L7XZ58_9HELO|nr:uncharacterized protein PAC_20166 [Phialocephala subalpina]
MAHVDPFLQFDDESFALELQLEEIGAQRKLQSGKWTEYNPPDFALAFDDFAAELKRAIVLVGDLKFAHSIARAVDSDAVAIEESRLEETQSVQDRDFALSLNEDENLPSQDVTNLAQMSCLGAESVDWDDVLRAIEASTFSNESSSTAAGPSVHYSLRQRAVLEHLLQLKVQCSVCGEAVYPHFAVRLPCLKSFFLRVTKDESLIPPKCHRQPIDISTIKEDFLVWNLLARIESTVLIQIAPSLFPCRSEQQIAPPRVVAMAQELQANYECDHSGKFTKLEGSRRGKVCEICGTRHRKYILSCKRWHMLACEDCRRHRL